jgi:N-acetyl-gamma-glutamyl-phosphate reductase
MQKWVGLEHPPVFAPMVGRYYRGMIVEVPLHLWALPGEPTTVEVHDALVAAYRGEKLVQVAPLEGGTARPAEAVKVLSAPVAPVAKAPASLDAEQLKLTNGMTLYVCGNDKYGQVRLIALLDNLGKGASGAAVQNLNIMLGLPETTGLL